MSNDSGHNLLVGVLALRAVEAGWNDFERLQADPDLAILREHPEFKSLTPPK